MTQLYTYSKCCGSQTHVHTQKDKQLFWPGGRTTIEVNRGLSEGRVGVS